MVDPNQIQDLIARPTAEGIFRKSYFYGGRKFSNFPEAMKARSEALDKARIWNISEGEIRAAETALEQRGGKKRFLGRWDLFVRDGQEDKVSSEVEVSISEKPSVNEYASRPAAEAAEADSSKGRLNIKNAFIWLGIGIFSLQIVAAFGMLPESYLGQGLKTLYALAFIFKREFISLFMVSIIITLLLPLPTALTILVMPKYRNLDSVAKNYRIWHMIIAAFAATSLIWFV